jgi:hypothetical protein
MTLPSRPAVTSEDSDTITILDDKSRESHALTLRVACAFRWRTQLAVAEKNRLPPFYFMSSLVGVPVSAFSLFMPRRQLVGSPKEKE